MRQLALLTFVVVGGLLEGCIAEGAPTEYESGALAVSMNLSDNVQVEADRLIFANVARSGELAGLVERVRAWESAYRLESAEAPATLDEIGREVWTTARLREKGVEPVYLVGKRQANAVEADGSLREGLKNPNGYLRRATGVSTDDGGNVVFATRRASLSEARDELTRQGFATVRGDGCWPQSSYPFNIARIDLSRTLYDKQFGSIGRMAISFKDSFLTVDGNLESEVTGRCLSPESAMGVLTTKLRGQIVLEGSFDGAFGATTGAVPLFHKRFDIASVAGYPLALDFSVSATCDFTSTGKVRAAVGTTVEGSVRAGATWASAPGFAGVYEPTWPRFGVVSPTFTTNANVTANCTVTTKALALVFDSDEGPYADTSAFLQLDAVGQGSGTSASVNAKVTAGVDAGGGGTLKPFHVTLVDQINVRRYRKEWRILDRDVSLGN